MKKGAKLFRSTPSIPGLSSTGRMRDEACWLFPSPEDDEDAVSAVSAGRHFQTQSAPVAVMARPHTRKGVRKPPRL